MLESCHALGGQEARRIADRIGLAFHGLPQPEHCRARKVGGQHRAVVQQPAAPQCPQLGRPAARIEPVERRAFLQRLIPCDSFSLLYAQHVAYYGRALFDQACALDLEGIVAKLASAPYRPTQPPHWIKIKNPSYSQAEGRHEFFEPSRNRR
jgi:hypothetical protein